MQKTITTLIEDIDSVLLHGDKSPSEEVLESFANSVKSLMRTRLTEWTEERPPTLRMSELGKPDSQIWHKVNGHQGEVIDAQTRLKFLYGDLTELLILALAKLAGHTVTNEQEEVELHGIKGHIDCLIDGELVDVKSAASYSYEKFENGELFEKDNFGYVTQISAYAQSKGLKRGFLLAMDKQYGYTCTLEIPEEKMVDAGARIDFLKELIKGPKPPCEGTCSTKTEENGNITLTSPCHYCPHKFSCHPELRAFKYSTGPKYFVKVVKEPTRVEEIT